MYERPAAGSELAGFLWRSGSAVWACALLTVLAVLLAATPARASGETVIGFDELKAGTVVTNQYAGQGLELGTAETFKQPKPEHGDCGSPKVAGEPTAPAFSKPNYAELPSVQPRFPLIKEPTARYSASRAVRCRWR